MVKNGQAGGSWGGIGIHRQLLRSSKFITVVDGTIRQRSIAAHGPQDN